MKIPKVSKKTIFISIAVILLISLVVGSYLFWNSWKKSASSGANTLNKAGEALDKMIENAAKGVLPSMGTNPLENKPDINPVDKTNPYKNIKTNPFE